MRLEIAGRAIIGSKEPQQDSWRVFNARGENLDNAAKSSGVVAGDGTLVIVADGIGGYAGGEVASRVACDAFGRAFFSKEGAPADCREFALEAANQAIAEEKRRSADLRDMGCTLVAVYFYQGSMTFVSVGDSLLLRSRDDEIHRVNVDHSYFDYLDRQVLGSDDPQRWSLAVRDTRRRASLTLALTGDGLSSSEFGHKPQIAVRPLLADDVVIVASDGIETLDLVQLQNFMLHLRPKGTLGIADGLIKAVDGIGKTRSYQDNTTIVVIGASEGAGLTRVSLATPARVAKAPAESLGASLFSRLPVLSSKMLITGIGVFGVLLLVVLVLFATSFTNDRVNTSSQTGVERGANDAGKPPGKKKDPDATTNDRATANQPPDQNTQQQQAPTPLVPPPDRQADSRDSDAVSAPPSTEDRAKPPTGRDNGEIKRLSDGLAWDGEILRSVTQTNSGACMLQCVQDPMCVAYTWHADNRCNLQSSVSKPMSEPKARSGVRMWRDVAWQGVPLKKPAIAAESAIVCFTACLNDKECGGSTWRKDLRCELFSPEITGRKSEMDAFSASKETR